VFAGFCLPSVKGYHQHNKQYRHRNPGEMGYAKVFYTDARGQISPVCPKVFKIHPVFLAFSGCTCANFTHVLFLIVQKFAHFFLFGVIITHCESKCDTNSSSGEARHQALAVF
jgi:hypothetical protein